MKKYEIPTVELEKVETVDVIAASLTAPTDPIIQTVAQGTDPYIADKF